MRLLLYFLLATAVYFLLFFPRWRKRSRTGVLLTLFYVYICAVIYLTLLPLPTTFDPEVFDGNFGNFIPFRDLKMGYRGAKRDIILNVIMTVPFGLLFPQIQKSGALATTILGFLISTTIEILQLLATVLGSPYHAFDVTDIISNTTGTLLGYLFFTLIQKYINKNPENH